MIRLNSINKLFFFVWGMMVLFQTNVFAQFEVKKLDFTLLIYMNGSDLESKYKQATKDIAEMLQAYDSLSHDFEIALLHGGTKQWYLHELEGLPELPSDSITYAQITKYGYQKIKSLENKSIGNPETLAEFITYSITNFPAKRYGLIFWNHGRGSVYGFGYDENFTDDVSLTLSEIAIGLKNGLADAHTFEFIGFDACLMGTLEVATTLVPYANYMIASQELEPGDGWDYRSVVGQLCQNPNVETESFSKNVIDSFIDYYAQKSAQVTLSLLDLQQINELNKSLSELTFTLNARLSRAPDAFKQTSAYRVKSKSFGMPSFTYLGEDMIDLFSFYQNASIGTDSLFLNFKNTLQQAVVYNRFSDNLARDVVSGLSVYFPYFNKKLAKKLGDYFNLSFNEAYIAFVKGFAQQLTTPVTDNVFERKPSRQLTPTITVNTRKIYLTIRQTIPNTEQIISYGLDAYDVNVNSKNYITLYNKEENWNTKWISIEGINVCVFMGIADPNTVTYTVPVRWNGQRAELIIRYDKNNLGKLTAKVVGVREITEMDLPDKVKELAQNDEIVFLAPDALTEQLDYELGTIRVQNPQELKVKLQPMPQGKYQVGFCLLDFYGNKHYTDFEDFEVK